jgi:hypothetical protein
MNGIALKILKKVSMSGEVSLAAVLRMAKPRHRNHLDQYPLALLLEAGYLGATINHTPPAGAEEMREFSLAITLYMFALPKDDKGIVNYLGIKSSGSIDLEKERVFLKAKGSLYLDELKQKFWDRMWSFVLGFSAGLLVAIASAWLKEQLKLP